MKTLDEIINRQDYVRLNAALIARAHEVAPIIRNKMKEINMKVSKTVPGIALEKTTIWNGNVGHDEYILCYRVEITGEDRYYCELSGCAPFKYYKLEDVISNEDIANSKMFLYFMNNVRNILNEIDELETKKVSEIEKALAETSNIK